MLQQLDHLHCKDAVYVKVIPVFREVPQMQTTNRGTRSLSGVFECHVFFEGLFFVIYVSYN